MTRDRFALNRIDLLKDYAAISRTRPGAAVATAMRNQSVQYLDILAMEATKGEWDWAHLRQALSNAASSSQPLDAAIPGTLADIGRLLMLQPRSEEDLDLGFAAMDRAMRAVPPKKTNARYRRLMVEHLILTGDLVGAAELLDAWSDVDAEGGGYLRAEMDNPFVFPDGDKERWLANFNEPLASEGLWPISIGEGDGDPFDRIVCAVSPAEQQTPAADGPLVTVVVPTYQPKPGELETAVDSILRQTLQDFEIIIVDDCSGEDFDEVLARMEAVDDRIRIMRTSHNSGAYVARNVGYGAARGRYVTGQDDDDWSHPERLARQVAFLRAHPEAAGCRAWAYTVLPNLCRVRRGYRPTSANASSVMMATSIFRRVGGFLEVRKAADTELHLRVERLTGKKILDLREPLTLVRITPDSLSRSEFRAGWAHPARQQFKNSYGHWHETARLSDLTLSDEAAPHLMVPQRFRVDQASKPPHYDVVFAGHWAKMGGPQKSMMEEIKALLAQGRSVAIMDIEPARFMTTAARPLHWSVQALVNDGVLDQLLLDDSAEVDLLILRYPPILQFITDEKSNLKVGRMIVLANQAPSEQDGRDIRYLVPDCHANAERLFNTTVTWAPQGPQVREAIEPYLTNAQLEPFDIPGILNPDEWGRAGRRRRRSLVPVIGRHSRDDRMKWPSSADELESVYPTAGNLDVRIMGGAKTPMNVLGLRAQPAAWTVYRTDAMPVPEFLNTLDFFVFYQHPQATEAFGRSILEAIAAGLVVILPPHYEEVFGRGAVYAPPELVQSVITRYHENRSLYEQQREAAREEFVERFSHQAYAELISTLLDGQEERESAQ